MTDRERARTWLHKAAGPIVGMPAVHDLAAEFAAVRAEARAPLVAALRLAVEAMEMAEDHVRDSCDDEAIEILVSALAACRKAVGE